jgi:DNA-binding response OmpR family regulator/glycine cleavage system H lipoate-binding protein
MSEQHPMLVVDDEQVVCEACRRIFSQQGFQVEVNTNARQGLSWATEKDYEIILLDIKMPNMDGIQFLEQLRDKRPDVPVLIITGYPSIPNAAAAMRLGACDYVSKPFTCEEITSAVQRVLQNRRPAGEELGTNGEANEAVPPSDAGSDVFFWDEAWLRMELDGSACVGAVLPGLRGAMPDSVTLPRIGEVVYQGLPLAGVSSASKPQRVIPSPVSGVIVAVNELLRGRPQLLASDPCGEGWIACICTTQYEEEAKACRRRRVLLVSSDPVTAEEQSQQLARLGCQVQLVQSREQLISELRDLEDRVAILDAASLGETGPGLAQLINSQAPALRIVVNGSPQDGWETAYRKHKILYYAVEPFVDNEIADILAAGFRKPEAPAAERPQGPSEPVSGISITNRNGHKVQLLAAPGLLWRNEGLGSDIAQELLARMLPVAVTPGMANLSPANILKTASANDRLMVLLAKDGEFLPGRLARDTKPDFGVDPGDAANKVTMLSVQPDATGGLAGWDRRTTMAVADHIVREMTLY